MLTLKNSGSHKKMNNSDTGKSKSKAKNVIEKKICDCNGDGSTPH